ncbi:mitochondrial carrier domain-containing protein [Coniella lustricola]|uniref:Mitochondrial carrier domain-containing protein n=1 Tax=Coniella lustricola TaxID=2025994 RepID=A0A2T3A0W1_9PEZI|nr:mitochondrial carrier domain-containing protein [Coniella lustricola]
MKEGQTLLVESIAGFSSGLLQTFVAHPLEIIKTRMQVDKSVKSIEPQLKALDVVKQLLKSEHPAATTFRGITPNLIGSSVGWASFFAMKKYAEDKIISFKTCPLSEDGIAATKATLSWYDHGLASAIAGVSTQVLSNPIWVVKVRMLASDAADYKEYHSTWSTVKSMYQKEGLKAFYSGMGISMFGVVQGAIQFAVYDTLNKYASKKEDGTIPKWETVVFSSASKAISIAMLYPYQPIRTRLQVHNAEAEHGKGIRGVSVQLWKEGGMRAFWKGGTPAVVRTLPATCVTFLVYEWLKPYLYKRLDKSSSRELPELK